MEAAGSKGPLRMESTVPVRTGARTSSVTRNQRWLFLIHVDWRWIRQRPHWFAEEALRRHHVLVAYRLHPRRSTLPKNRSAVCRVPLLPLPLRPPGQSRSARAGALCHKAWVSLLFAAFRPTHVYISHPKLTATLPRDAGRNAILVYDCMDDAVAMAPPSRRGATLLEERRLVSRADVIVLSSQVLAERIRERSGAMAEGKMRVILNGVNPSSLRRRVHPTQRGSASRVVVCYAGTVDEWFDFDALLTALEACPGVSLRIIGPRTGREPVHARIEYVRPVEHDQLPTLLCDCAALIMPFRMDRIVAAVNPVKLYEYLGYRVPVIATRYPEIEREFGALVEFYKTPADLIDLLHRLENGELQPGGGREEVEAFIKSASWRGRWDELRTAVEQVCRG